MRRSFISATSIKRLISSHNRIQKEKYNNQLINSQNGIEKELSPQYELVGVDFNENTRATKIEIKQTQHYRTIERYVTQNYVKYPIYSDWKVKTKLLHKSIKLTNIELENLNNHVDELISMFASEIIASLNHEDMYPSWFIRKFLTEEHNLSIKNLKNEFNNYKSEQHSFINSCNNKILENNTLLKNTTNLLNKKTKRKSNKESLLAKISNRKKSILFCILTFGIYAYSISSKRKAKILRKIELLTAEITDINNKILNINKNVNNLNNKIKESKDSINRKEKDTNNAIELENKTYNENYNNIQPLQNIYNQDNSFTPLKLFIGLEYEKIIGCYIIHNKEKDKYYVGQSKDVLKRIKQHFKGTTPNNIIFAEDYYSSQFENKADIFEIKIIKCLTKDELDRTEKRLINEYDAWNSGYNGTSGNI